MLMYDGNIYIYIILVGHGQCAVTRGRWIRENRDIYIYMYIYIILYV